MRFITDSGIRKIAIAAVETGKWKCESGKRHNKLTHIPSNITLGLATTPSDHRAIKNLMCEMRQIENGTHKMFTIFAAHNKKKR